MSPSGQLMGSGFACSSSAMLGQASQIQVDIFRHWTLMSCEEKLTECTCH